MSADTRVGHGFKGLVRGGEVQADFEFTVWLRSVMTILYSIFQPLTNRTC